MEANTHQEAYVVCNTNNTPDGTCSEISPYRNTCANDQLSSGGLVEASSSNSVLPLFSTANNNIPNIVITGCNFTNCNASVGSKFDMNKEASIDMDKLLKGLTAEQLFDDW